MSALKRFLQQTLNFGLESVLMNRKYNFAINAPLDVNNSSDNNVHKEQYKQCTYPMYILLTHSSKFSVLNSLSSSKNVSDRLTADGSFSIKAAIQSYPSIFCCCLEYESIWYVRLSEVSLVGLLKLTLLVFPEPDCKTGRKKVIVNILYQASQDQWITHAQITLRSFFQNLQLFVLWLQSMWLSSCAKARISIMATIIDIRWLWLLFKHNQPFDLNPNVCILYVINTRPTDISSSEGWFANQEEKSSFKRGQFKSGHAFLCIIYILSITTCQDPCFQADGDWNQSTRQHGHCLCSLLTKCQCINNSHFLTSPSVLITTAWLLSNYTITVVASQMW